MIINEKIMLKTLNSAKRVLLVEPPYPSDYPPLGLAKIKSYLEDKGIHNTFSREMRYEEYDLICVTSIFTYYSKQVFDVINSRGLIHQETPILVGGVLASILPDVFNKFDNLNVFRGYSKILDGYKPDYSIVNKGSQFDDYSIVFTSRGCPNKCAYCVVWKIEKQRWVNPDWKKIIDLSKPNIMISDNNLSAIPLEHLKDIVQFVNEHEKKVMFNSGFDCKYITKEMAQELAKVKFVKRGMRSAFDRIEEDGVFQDSIKLLLDNGVSKSNMLIYTLFNFTDTPKDAHYRASECARLGVRPYPQWYRPLTILNKKHVFISKYWTRNLCKVFRQYWSLNEIWGYTEFEDYLYSKEVKERFHLKKIDYRTWETNGGTEKLKKKDKKYFKNKKNVIIKSKR